jgi:hypothetical protein
MAKIIKTNTQEQALKTITANLRTLTGINAVLNNPAKQAVITTTAGKDKSALTVDKAFADGILDGIRKRMVSEIRALAKKNAIVLDDDDKAILDNVNAKKTSSEKKADAPADLVEDPTPDPIDIPAETEDFTAPKYAGDEYAGDEYADEEYADDPDESEAVSISTESEVYNPYAN